ncbi:MAG: hypothetical protein ABIV94_09755 [Acidimicrobiales bacterium]
MPTRAGRAGEGSVVRTGDASAAGGPVACVVAAGEVVVVAGSEVEVDVDVGEEVGVELDVDVICGAVVRT